MRTPADRAETGKLGEDAVAHWLEARGYVLVARNARVGRLEIDIIARRASLLIFCEVRTRRSSDWVHPAYTFDAAKRKRIRRAAAGWLERERPRHGGVRFDAAAVVLGATGDEPQIEYYEGAF